MTRSPQNSCAASPKPSGAGTDPGNDFSLPGGELVAAAGANYVARWTTYHVFELMESMQNAIRKDGFTFVEIMSQCPVSYGKVSGFRDAVSFLHHLKDTSIHIDEARGLPEEKLAGKIVVGKLAERNRTEFTQALADLNREREAAILAELGQGSAP